MAIQGGAVVGGIIVGSDDDGVPNRTCITAKMEDGSEWVMQNFYRRDQVRLVERGKEGSDGSEVEE